LATLAQRNNNPGNLRGADGRFRSFATLNEGWQALVNDLLAKMTGRTRTGLNGSSTLLELFRVYAPVGDGSNNPATYANNVAARLGVSVSTPIGSLISRVQDVANAIAIQEGFYQGGQLPVGNAPLAYNLSTSDAPPVGLMIAVFALAWLLL
jgi:hypothetical protein